MTPARRFADAFLAGDTRAALDRLAPDAVFHSPVTDYRGTARIAPVLGALGRVIGGVAPTVVLEDGDQAIAVFTTAVGGRTADGVLRVVGGPDGAVTDVTLLLRPLEALLAGVEQMKVALR